VESYNNGKKKETPASSWLVIDNSPFKIAEPGRVTEAFGEWVAVDLQLCNLSI
jgi:hypothetical protein